MKTDPLKEHINRAFAPYEALKPVGELKEELYRDMQERFQDLRNQGYDEETALKMTLDSMGEISEIVSAITEKGKELQQNIHADFRASNMQNSDLSSIVAEGRNFDYSNLRKSDFSSSDLRNGSFRYCNLADVNFNKADLTGAKIKKSELKGATFDGAVLDNVDFRMSNLQSVSFDNLTLNGVNFDYSGLRNTSFRNATLINVSLRTDLKKTVFDGATMDKLTYAVLKAYKADVSKVIVR